LISGNSYMPFRVSNGSAYILRNLVYDRIERDLEKTFPWLLDNPSQGIIAEARAGNKNHKQV